MSATLQKKLFAGLPVEVNDEDRAVNIPTFIKWAGGKTQLLSQFKTLFPKKFDRYLEPFLGSGAVFFYMKKMYRQKEIILSDNNRELINCYEIVQNELEVLIKLLQEHRKNHSKDYYYSLRAMETSNLSKIESAARFIYLNKTCFNGLYRVNSRGKFNVPIGSYKNPSIYDERILREANNLLQGVNFLVMPFENVLDLVESDDFIYFDPPYHPLSTTSSFTSYTSESFSKEDQIRLAKVYAELDKKGCSLMLSNSYSEFILDLYKDYNIKIVNAKRMINSNGQKRGAISEAVILNY
jgi:DNA adenine methylase